MAMQAFRALVYTTIPKAQIIYATTTPHRSMARLDELRHDRG